MGIAEGGGQRKEEGTGGEEGWKREEDKGKGREEKSRPHSHF